MRCVLCAAVILGAGLLVARDLNAQDARIEEVGKSPVEAKFPAGGKIRMDLCSSGVELRGSADDRLRVSYRSEQERNADVRIRLRTAGDQAHIRVTGCPHNNFKLTIEVPKSSNLRVRMFAGELTIKEITGDKDVQLHAGELTMEVGEPSDYSRVEASVTSGDLEAAPFNVSKGGLFRSFERTGPGKYRLYAHVGAGQVELR